MNAKQYEAAIRLSTQQALKSGQISLPEILGTLELAKINCERLAYQHAVAQQLNKERETASGILLPPNVAQMPKA